MTRRGGSVHTLSFFSIDLRFRHPCSSELLLLATPYMSNLENNHFTTWRPNLSFLDTYLSKGCKLFHLLISHSDITLPFNVFSPPLHRYPYHSWTLVHFMLLCWLPTQTPPVPAIPIHFPCTSVPSFMSVASPPCHINVVSVDRRSPLRQPMRAPRHSDGVFPIQSMQPGTTHQATTHAPFYPRTISHAVKQTRSFVADTSIDPRLRHRY